MNCFFAVPLRNRFYVHAENRSFNAVIQTLTKIPQLFRATDVALVAAGRNDHDSRVLATTSLVGTGLLLPVNPNPKHLK